jgi:hypothetical protein
MTTRHLGLVAGALLSVAGVGHAGDPKPQAEPPSPVVVRIAFQDGFLKQLNAGPGRCGMWTTQFPRVPDWTPPANQLPINAVSFLCERTPEGVKVAIGALRGSPHQKEDAIASVHVTRTRPVVVNEMRAFGILPLTLSLIDVPRPGLAPPKVTIASPRLVWLDASVVETPRATYRVVFQNQGDKAVRGIALEGWRSGRLATSGRRVGRDGAPLIDVAGEFTFDSLVPMGRAAGDGSAAMSPLDELRITAVVWADGSYEGGVAGQNIVVVDHGNRIQVGRAVIELQRATSPAGLRAALNGLSIEVPESLVDATVSALAIAPPVDRKRLQSLLVVALQSIKTEALSNLTEFDRGPQGPGAFEAWIKQTTGRYRGWHDRLLR